MTRPIVARRLNLNPDLALEKDTGINGRIIKRDKTFKTENQGAKTQPSPNQSQQSNADELLHTKN